VGARRVPGAEVLSVRREGAALPPLPADEHLILANGDRVPARDLRLDGERLYFRHPDLAGGKEVSVPLAAVAVFWRAAPDRVVVPERLRRRLAAGTRTRDVVLLRNGDTLEGTLVGLGKAGVEVEVGKKKSSARLSQVAAFALSTDLADKLPAKGPHARLVLAPDDRSPGGRLTLVSASCDGKTFRGRTPFGAHVRVPLARVSALDVSGPNAVYLSDLKPAKYEYLPYLDEKWPWAADCAVTGRDLRLGGSTYDKGLGVHAHCRLTYSLGGAFRRFEALVGLDDLEGRKGSVRIKVLGDGKVLTEEPPAERTHADGPARIRVSVEGVKELTLEVESASGGNVQDVVDWADARLVK
jgi:hypothetical protein